MTTSRLNKRWTLITILLVVIIITGNLVAWSRYGRSQPIEISISPAQESSPGVIYIGGAVNNPGFYTLKAEDSIEALIQAAGGTTGNADLTKLELYIPPAGDEQQPPSQLNQYYAQGCPSRLKYLYYRRISGSG